MAATRGHLSDNGGVRGHSAGDIFPFILVGTGDDMWHVQLPDGRLCTTYIKAADAYDTAILLKEMREHLDISKMPVPLIKIALIKRMRGENYAAILSESVHPVAA